METFQAQGVPDRPPDLPGFDAVRCLGRGAQGEVWLMAPHDGGEQVAAKFITLVPGSAGDDMNAAAGRHNESQITQEWRVLDQFRHEHLVAVRGLAEDARGVPAIIMDHAAGGSLAQLVHARGPATVGEAVTILTPMGQVLAYLHGRGAVHGDLSPGNVLFSAVGKPLLADFGFGRMLGQPPVPPAGTPGYHCPHDIARDEAADVFALAAIGWFALTGKAPPATRDRLPLGTFVRDVPAELVAALEAGLNEDSTRRPTAAAFAQAVFRSAPAEALALGSAVHPSVLPQLPTRHQSTGRGLAGRPGRVLHRKSRGRWRPATVRRRAQGRGGSGRVPGLSRMWTSGNRESSAPRGRARRLWLLAGAAAMASILLATAMVLGREWGGPGNDAAAGAPPEAAPAAAPGTNMAWAGALPPKIQRDLAAAEPVTALHALAWLRSYALSNADQELVDMVNVPDSNALAADSAIVGELAARGHRLTGLDITVAEAHAEGDADAGSAPAQEGAAGTPSTGTAMPPAGTKITVEATVNISSFAEQDKAGVLIHNTTGEQTQELDFILANVDGRWRIQQILAAVTR
ncbi:hypothetical protein JOF48_003741 [Arthrobacter stackebrandtii]|uniref:non-specific serine/threonine protein kinase n=1 Tax=Arthrobacter stackebrandtii TaxID=272161 RepID=A0ABS4Z2L4_9MICC|nr:serine/threonine-protein kinase [Arthrobacter stackebrandtii]MBP2414942.1 hypothetical protein [Arthrobacter stackebrandtii]